MLADMEAETTFIGFLSRQLDLDLRQTEATE
jgi:hypothetical protein